MQSDRRAGWVVRVWCSVVTEGPEFRAVPFPTSNWPHLSIRYVSDVLGGPGFEFRQEQIFVFSEMSRPGVRPTQLVLGLIAEAGVT
jgi:hypothetical protein